ncbi:putative protein S-acyltransferase 7 [Zea mays]|uniref:S-acyltransferase n=1 Tax=Zea mays TaxID=4577 RepID=A0A1D6PYF9_MAIZE|nr:putative protein S-acyltransferase 7 [Zea mays]
MYMPPPPPTGGAGEQPRLYQVWRGSNEFFLQGRFIFGPDVRSVFLTMILIIAPVVVFCLFVARHLINDFPDSWGISVMVVVVVFTIYDLTLLLCTSGRDPGIIPRNSHPPEPESIDGINDTGVQTPQQFRLPRTKEVLVNGISVRVKYCDTCMCIGLRNYRFFYMFVFSTTLLCLYVFAFCWVYVIKIRAAEQSSVWKALLKTPASVALIIYCFLCVWFVGGLSVFHLYLMSTNQTTYENFRYRYDRRDNPYNKGVLNNFLEIFCTAIPPSKNNFRARVTAGQGLQQTRSQSRGFMSPSMGKPIGDLEMDRKPVAPWDEPRTAADIRDLEAGLGVMFDEKEGRVAHASPDLSRDLPAEFVEGRSGMHSRQSSWVQRGDAIEASAVQMANARTTEASNNVAWSGTH